MAILVSPGVQVREFDLTNIIPAVSTSIGGFAGGFQWGPVSEIISISNEKELIARFGQPNNETAEAFFIAASFLRYSNHLKTVRVVGSSAVNAVSELADGLTAGAAALVKNMDDYENGITATGQFVAKYPGALANGIEISICPASTSDTVFDAWAYAGLFDTAPTTSEYAANNGASNDEMHVAIIDATGVWTGTAGEVMETFSFVSQIPSAKKPNGETNYYVDILNNTSKYVWWNDHSTVLLNAGEAISAVTGGDYLNGVTPAVIDLTLAGGVSDDTPTIGQLQLDGFDLLKDAETVDVNLVMSAPGSDGGDDVAHAQYLLSFAEQRMDCVVFISPPVADTVGTSTPQTDVLNFFNQLTSSSYGVFDSGALKMYDKYNDVYRWIPASGHIAGLCAHTDDIRDPWWSPAGYNRGQLRGVTKLAFNPKQADRDELYKKRVNPIVSFPGEGIILYGDKTAQAKPSAFDRINVRRLFIVMEKAIATAAKYQLFEFNDAFTRAQFKNMIEPYLRDIQGRRGIYDFLVVCDETNNTGEVIDSNNFVADIYIKPARSINFITLNFVATRTGVEFSEVVGQFG